MHIFGQFVGLLIDGYDPKDKQTISSIKQPMLINGGASTIDSAKYLYHDERGSSYATLSVNGMAGYDDVLGKLKKKMGNTKESVKKVVIANYARENDTYAMKQQLTAEDCYISNVDMSYGSVSFTVFGKIHWETFEDGANRTNAVINVKEGKDE